MQTLRAAMTDREYDEFLRLAEETLARRERYAFVLHLETLSMDAVRRRKMADLLKEYEPALRECCLGGAIITNSRISAAFVTAVRWMVPSPHPEQVFSDATKAYAFAERLLTSAGLTVPTPPTLALPNLPPSHGGAHDPPSDSF